MGYKKEIFKGVSWVGALRLSTRIISFLRTVLLARILSPSQFGIYGIAMLFTAFLEVVTETGVNVILIQEKEKIDKYINSAWIVSIIRGILVALVIIISAPFVANFFNSPDSIILLYLISAVPFLRGFINPASVKFQKELKFHKEFWYRFSIFSFDSLVAILFAFLTYQASSLIFGLIAGVILEVILSFVFVSPRPNFSLDKNYLFRIFHRGKWITLSGIFNYLFHNFDNIVVGKILGAVNLGLYQMAYSISMLPITDVSDVISKVTFPVYTIISGDKLRLRNAFFKTMFFVSLITVPLGIIMFTYSYEIVKFVLGQKWLGIVDVLRVLVVFGIIRAISGSTSTLFLSVGKQNYVAVVTFVSMLGILISIYPLVTKMGIMGAGISALIGTLIAIPFMGYFTFKILK